jgi:Uma2 family endonuclease
MDMELSTARTKHWTRLEYERLVDLGAFQPGERLELVGGALVVREPQGGPHATAVGLAEDALREAFGAGWTVRAQSPIALDEDSEPEPDIAIVPGTRRDYRGGHPSHPVLIVEVADSSLPLDRREKASLYARARIADYWIVNLVDRLLEVYREPVADLDSPYGWRYRSTAILHAGDVVTPLARARSTVPVSDLLL